MNFPVFDLHCDTAFALMGPDYCEYGNLRNNEHHFDLNRASKLPGYAQCFACMGTTLDMPWSYINPVQFFERQLATIQREVDKNSSMISIAYSAADIRRNTEKGKMSAILTLEGPASFGFDGELLPDLYAVGFRITTLCWNEANPLTGSHLTGGGLTQQGKDFVRQAQSCGMILDVSHASDEAFRDVIEIAEAPVIASHSNSRATFNHSRNITDDMFHAICELDGVVGLNMFSEFVAKDATLQDASDHLLHWLELDPEGTHIALGSDMDGCDSLCTGFEGVQDYPKLAQLLLDRGVSEKIISNIFWNNAMGVIERCCI